MKSNSSTIDHYKASGVTIMSIDASYHIDHVRIQHDLTRIGKRFHSIERSTVMTSFLFFLSVTNWSDHVEYVLDTLDYIQLHQNELDEFHELARQLSNELDEYRRQLSSDVNIDRPVFLFNVDQLNQRIELVNRNGDFLLRSSLTSDNDNGVEHCLNTINRAYERLLNDMEMMTKSEQENKSMNEQVTRYSIDEHIESIDLSCS
jgi:hypothetical protein